MLSYSQIILEDALREMFFEQWLRKLIKEMI